MPTAGRHILARLHQVRIQIELRMLRDPSFRALCEDYDIAVEALEHWRQSSLREAAARVADYQMLTADLEKEILTEVIAASGGA